jgi:GTP-binding protein EngB required for normal cell division
MERMMEVAESEA